MYQKNLIIDKTLKLNSKRVIINLLFFIVFLCNFLIDFNDLDKLSY